MIRMPLDLHISPGSATPIFKQIVDQVRLALATETLATGEQLPSVRVLAERLVLNPNTIARAYAELARDGLIETQQGKGVFVASRPRAPMYTKTERLRRLEPSLAALVHEAIALGVPPGELTEALEKKLARLNLTNTSNITRSSSS